MPAIATMISLPPSGHWPCSRRCARINRRLDTIRNRDGLQLLGEAGYGDRRPLPDALGASDDDFRKNRRIDIRFVLTSRTSDELNRLRAHILEAIGTP